MFSRRNDDETLDKTLDIPDFVEDKTKTDSSVDMSIFKMSDDELYDDDSEERSTEDYDEDDDDELRPRRKKGNGPLIICLIIIFLLLALCAGALFYGLKQHQA